MVLVDMDQVWMDEEIFSHTRYVVVTYYGKLDFLANFKPDPGNVHPYFNQYIRHKYRASDGGDYNSRGIRDI